MTLALYVLCDISGGAMKKIELINVRRTYYIKD